MSASLFEGKNLGAVITAKTKQERWKARSSFNYWKKKLMEGDPRKEWALLWQENGFIIGDSTGPAKRGRPPKQVETFTVEDNDAVDASEFIRSIPVSHNPALKVSFVPYIPEIGAYLDHKKAKGLDLLVALDDVLTMESIFNAWVTDGNGGGRRKIGLDAKTRMMRYRPF